MGIAELRQGYAEFRGPPERIDQRRNIPHGVPRIVLLIAVTVDGIVALHTAWIHAEFKTGTAVVVGIDDDLDLITADALVAAGEGLTEVCTASTTTTTGNSGIMMSRRRIQVLGCYETGNGWFLPAIAPS